MVEKNQPIPKVIIIKDEQGLDQEYEVLEESEEEESSQDLRGIDLSQFRPSESPHSNINLRPLSSAKGQIKIATAQDNIEEESYEYYEECIEESEEESLQASERK